MFGHCMATECISCSKAAVAVTAFIRLQTGVSVQMFLRQKHLEFKNIETEEKLTEWLKKVFS